MAAFRTLDQLQPKGKRVLVRVDLNVPMADGVVTDRTRIERIVPTISELSNKGAKVILLAHFGRPKGKVVEEMSLRPVAQALEEELDHRVDFAASMIDGRTVMEIDPTCKSAQEISALWRYLNERLMRAEGGRKPADGALTPAMAAAQARTFGRRAAQ